MVLPCFWNLGNGLDIPTVLGLIQGFQNQMQFIVGPPDRAHSVVISMRVPLCSSTGRYNEEVIVCEMEFVTPLSARMRLALGQRFEAGAGMWYGPKPSSFQGSLVLSCSKHKMEKKKRFAPAVLLFASRANYLNRCIIHNDYEETARLCLK